MKKTTAAFLAFLFVITVAGCGADKTVETDGPEASGNIIGDATTHPDVNFGPKETAQQAPDPSRFEYEWTGTVQRAWLSNLDETEWVEPLTPWSAATDDDPKIATNDGFELYAITNGQHCYPAIMYDYESILENRLSPYQDNMGIMISSLDRKTVYGCDVIHNTDGLFVEEIENDEVYIHGEYIVIDRDGYCRVIWVQKYDTGAYLKYTVTVRGGNAADAAAEYCMDAWNLDIDDVRTNGKLHILTHDDLYS